MLIRYSLDAIAIFWIAWFLYWLIAAANVKSARWREPLSQRWRHSIPFFLAAVLMIPTNPPWGVLRHRFIPFSPALPTIGALIVAVSLGFAVWARLHLGRDWSGTITLKEDHRLVTTGPYAFVRHPIYTGLLFAFVGTALAIGEWRCALATVFLVAGILVRCSAEEAKMRETFPDYDDYAGRTKRLIPFLY